MQNVSFIPSKFEHVNICNKDTNEAKYVAPKNKKLTEKFVCISQPAQNISDYQKQTRQESYLSSVIKQRCFVSNTEGEDITGDNELKNILAQGASLQQEIYQLTQRQSESYYPNQLKLPWPFRWLLLSHFFINATNSGREFYNHNSAGEGAATVSTWDACHPLRSSVEVMSNVCFLSTSHHAISSTSLQKNVQKTGGTQKRNRKLYKKQFLSDRVNFKKLNRAKPISFPQYVKNLFRKIKKYQPDMQWLMNSLIDDPLAEKCPLSPWDYRCSHDIASAAGNKLACQPISSAAEGVNDGNVVMPLLVASAAASTHHTALRSKLFMIAAGSVVSTVAIVAGKFLYNTFYLNKREDTDSQPLAERHIFERNYREIVPREDIGSQPLTDPFISERNDEEMELRSAALLISKSDSTEMRWRERLIEYFFSTNIDWSMSENCSDLELALAILLILKFDIEKHEPEIARIFLYGTGIFGESKNDKLGTSMVKLLAGDLLSQLLYGKPRHLYILEIFAEEREITIQEFHHKLTSRRFNSQDHLPETNEIVVSWLMDFFNQRYLSPVMPTLYLNITGHPLAQTFVGSATWFFMFIGAQFEWNEIKRNNNISPDKMVQMGFSLLLEKIKEDFLSEVSLIVELGMQIVSLFLDHDLKISNLQVLSELWYSFLKVLIPQLESLNNYQIKFEKAYENAVKASGELPWRSRDEATNKMIKESCLGKNITFFTESHPIDGLGYIDIYRFGHINETLRIIPENEVSEVTGNVYCHYDVDGEGQKDLKKLLNPTENYRNIVVEYVDKMKDLISVLIEHTLSGSDLKKGNLSYSDLKLFNDSSIIVINPAMRRKQQFPYTGRMERIPEVWLPKSDCTFIKVNEVNRTFILYTESGIPNIKELDQENVFSSIKSYFHIWPSAADSSNADSLFYIDFPFQNKGAIRKSKNESIEKFSQAITSFRTKNNVEKIFSEGSQPSLKTIIQDILFTILVPFYGCTASIFQADKENTLVNCSIDIIFIVGPMLNIGIKTAKKMYIALIKNINDKIYLSTFYKMVAFDGTILKSPTSVRYAIFRFDNIYSEAYIKLMFHGVKSAFFVLDPGVKFIFSVHKGLSITYSFFKRKVPTYYLVSRLSGFSGKIPDLMIRGNNLRGYTNSLRSNNIINRGMLYGIDNNDLDEKNLPIIYIGNVTYNIEMLNGISIIVGQTEDITPSGDKIFTLPHIEGESYNFVNFVCLSPSSLFCNLTLFLPPERTANDIKTHSVWEDNKIYYYSEEIENISNLIYYPNHIARLPHYKYSFKMQYNIVQLNDVYYLFGGSIRHLKPLFSGDDIIIENNLDSQSLKIERLKDNNRVRIENIKDIKNTNTINNQTLSDASYTVNKDLCEDSFLTFDLGKNILLNQINDNCYYLNISSVRNQFFIMPNNPEYASIPVTWSPENNTLVFMAPYIKRDSVHVGISLKNFIIKKEPDCQSIIIDVFPQLLMTGVVKYNGQHFIKIENRHYRLGEWNEGLCPLHCDSTESIAAWLRYDLFIETFEIIYEGDSFNTAKNRIGIAESEFEKTIRDYFIGISFKNITDSINTDKPENVSELELRMYQTVLLQRINPVDRMVLLSLPNAQVWSWSLHPDSHSIARKYPVMALWLSWQRQLNSLLSGVGEQPYILESVKKSALNNSFINNHYSLGKLFTGNSDDCETIWLEESKDNHSDIFLHFGVKLISFQNNFYGVNITVDNNMMKWTPDVKYVFPPSVTQFMYEKDQHSEIMVDMYKKNVWIKHPVYGFLNPNTTSRIEYVFVSPEDNWYAFLDDKKYLSLYSLENTKKDNDKEKGISFKLGYRLPENVSNNLISLCAIDNNGKFLFPKESTWYSFGSDYPLWASSKDYIPIFITPDQRFFGFSIEFNNVNIILYDKFTKNIWTLNISEFSSDSQSVSAVALSPMNALVALATNTSNIFIYDLMAKDWHLILEPLAKIHLQSLYLETEESIEITAQNIVMRFEGLFQYLSVIYNSGYYDQNCKDVLYYLEHYALTPRQPTNNVSTGGVVHMTSYLHCLNEAAPTGE